MCLNRCRQRRRQRRLLEDWRNMLDHAFNADLTPELQDFLDARGWRWLPAGVRATRAEEVSTALAFRPGVVA